MIILRIISLNVQFDFVEHKARRVQEIQLGLQLFPIEIHQHDNWRKESGLCCALSRS